MNQNTFSNLNAFKYLQRLALIIALIWAPSLFSQEDDDEEKLYELSPFTVSEEENVGYLATSTLAGTRIKSDLRDIASSISVYTQEFLEDIGANNQTDLLVYTTGTEVAGLGGTISNTSRAGNFGLDFAPERFTANPTTRVRGLAAADNTRDSYLTLVPFDSYNISRVTINRGANSILFGLGSPAGIVDRTLARPLGQDSTELQVRFDEYGSVRGTFDVNRVLIEGKLNARVVGLHDWAEFKQRPSFDKSQRIYGAFDFTPFENTRIRLNFETGERDGAPQVLTPPRDRLTVWWDYGNPIRPAGHSAFLTGEGGLRTATDIVTGGPPRGPIVFYDNGPSAGVTGGQLALPRGNGLTQAIIEEGEPLFGIVNPANHNRYEPQYITADDPVRVERGNRVGNPTNPAANFARSTQVLDRSIFDYENSNMAGRNDRRANDFVSYNIALEQTVLDNQAGIEFAFDRQEFDSSSVDFLGTGFRSRNLGIDINEDRADGSPNPNFGRPFIQASPRWSEAKDERDTFRVTAFATFDSGEKLGDGWKWLGKHTITGLFDNTNTESRSINGASFSYKEDFGAAVGYSGATRTINGNLRGQMLYHVGPNLLSASSAVGANIERLPNHLDLPTQATITYIDKATKKIRTGTFQTWTYPQDSALLTSGASLSSTETESLAFALQSKFWNDKIVTTFGLRNDEFKSFNAGAAPQNSLGTRQVQPNDFSLPSTPELTAEEDSKSLGVVVHMPDFIKENMPSGFDMSLLYSESENFSPSAVVRNPFGGFFPTSSGKTEDYGISLSFLDNRIVTRITRYETTQNNLPDARVNGPYNWFFNLIPQQVYANNTLEAINATNFPNLLPDPRIQDARGWQFVTEADGSTRLEFETGSGDIIDAVSEGYEIEVVANITSNWRLSINAAQQEAVRTGTAQTGFAEIERLANAWISDFAIGGDPDVPNSGLVENNNNGIRGRTQQQLTILQNFLIQDGKAADELREWRFNVVTNYTFDDDTALKGFGVGGGLRWQDKVVIGYDLKDDPDLGLVSDLTRPAFGPEETIADVWFRYRMPNIWDKIEWTIRLNIRNVFDENDLIPVYYNPPEAGLNSNVFRLQRGRDWFINSTFRF
jgi:outer membrane receptor for ferric coprogen and ferric-rhodotorulic acid